MASSSTTFTSGQSPTAAQVNGWAQGTLGYAQVTADQGSITTGSDLTSLSVTVTVVANRRIRISASVVAQITTAVGDQVNLRIQEGATVLMECPWAFSSANQNRPMRSAAVITPTAGAHTYKLQMSRDTGTGTVTMKAGATFPAFILVEDIGAV